MFSSPWLHFPSSCCDIFICNSSQRSLIPDLFLSWYIPGKNVQLVFSSSCVLLCIYEQTLRFSCLIQTASRSLWQSANEPRYTIFILAPLPLYFPSLFKASFFTKSCCSFPFPLQPQNTSTSNHCAMKLKQKGLRVYFVFGHKAPSGSLERFWHRFTPVGSHILRLETPALW